MYRPRDSVLHLFDPLSSLYPSTPRRDVTTPESDKENSEPVIAQSYDQLTMSTFFNRNYRVQHQNYSPVKQKGLLVDVTMSDGAFQALVDSSSTIDGATDEGTFTDEVNLNDSDDETESGVPRTFTNSSEPFTPAPSSPRTPLADIALQGETTVIARKKVYTRDILSMRGATLPEKTSSPVVRSISMTTPAPQGVPLASIINNVNFSGVSFASCTPGSAKPISDTQPIESMIPEETVAACIQPDGGSVKVVLSPPINLSTSTASTSSTSSSMFLGLSTATLLTDTAIPLSISPPSPPSTQERPHNDLGCSFPAPALSSSVGNQTQTHLRPHNTLLLDARPISADLQSSFIQCPETSFDLLHDSVSFFGVGGKGAGIIDGDEDSFDMSIQHRDLESQAMDQMVKKFRKLGNMRSDSAGSTTAIPTTSESCNNTPETRSKPKEIQQTSSSNEATPRASDGTVAVQWALNITPCSPDSPTVTFGQGFPKGIPANEIPSHTSPVSPEVSADTESNESAQLSPPLTSPVIPAISAPVFVRPLPRTPSPPRTPPKSIHTYATVAPTALAPAPVPALRIVKRKGHERTRSSVSSSSGEEKGLASTLVQKAEDGASRRISVVQALAPPSKDRTSGSVGSGRTSGSISTGMGTLTGPGRSIMPTRMAAPSTLANVAIAGVPGPVRCIGGPVRVPIEENSIAEAPQVRGAGAARYGSKSGVQKPSLGMGASMSGGGSGARRVPVTAPGNLISHPAPTGGGAAIVSGLKMPVRYGVGRTTLPRPISRLPAPSGFGRVKVAGGVVGTGNVNNGNARRVGGYGL